MTDNYDAQKKLAAKHAVQFIESNMIVGLGHGSTALFAVKIIADLLKNGTLHDIIAIPCSKYIEEEAEKLGIKLTTLHHHPQIDVTIDGADEVDPKLNLIKGFGGAILREKIVAQASNREIIIVDESKLVDVLGKKYPVPVEVVPFGWYSHMPFFKTIGADATLRMTSDHTPFITDHGNYIIDCRFNSLQDIAGIARKLSERAGVVEHGLFINIATDVIAATSKGIQHFRREDI